MAVESAIKVPDIGGAMGVDVIEILVKVGDTITQDTSLVTLESDKASMEIPSPTAGVVQSISMKVGDKVSEGDVILMLVANADESLAPAPLTASAPDVSPKAAPEIKAPALVEPPAVVSPSLQPLPAPASNTLISAGPAVRRLAHALGVNLADVHGSARKSRVSKEDVELFVKNKLAQPASAAGFSMPTAPAIDFSQFGAVEVKPLSKIKRLTGVNVHRAWVAIPHVTQFDEADITALEAFRQSQAEHATRDGFKLTILAFVCKVVSKALTVFPQFNASLDASGQQLIYKHYCNIGIAVETPNGLVVPVIKDVNRLSVGDIAKEMARLSTKAREKGLMPTDMNGGCFTISSLGGIGGTAFTPIVNSPEVAILGLSRASMKPVYEGGVFVPRLMLPLSLSYDHRVIDGAEAARFSRYVGDALSDIRRILL
ncbi:MAG TPA: dihydrolipoyllysine-residue acetyltransferase [Legionella sp.]|nr:dihydrolipoyllysine-residue acetyltransferase [Legionella sp.]